ncbi:MAG: redoxin domain-containing protein [Mariniblastus sp.]|nr:redoxin domain-containing protein [Mariniblastus sp.]
MSIGSKAPDIDIEHWVSDNDGMFEHVTKIETGKVYVIEFWATWCGPCIASMPHIAEIQKQYEDQDVQIISISDEDLETVEDFLERNVRGKSEDDEPKKTYEDLTNSYCLTTDPDKSVMKDYFRAAGRTGIPCAFIVGKSGLVEWIGHPMAIDKPLKSVVADDWDREKFKIEYVAAEKKKMEVARKRAELRKKMNGAMRGVQEKMADGDQDGAVDLIGDLLKDEDLKPAHEMFTKMRLQLMITIEHEDAATALEQFVNKNKNNGQALNEVAWGIYELFEENGGDVDTEILKQAKIAAEYAAKAEPKNGAILDTLAHFTYLVDEDLDKAIEIQKRAVANAGPQVDDIKPFLDELLKEKKTGKKKKKKKTESDF